MDRLELGGEFPSGNSLILPGKGLPKLSNKPFQMRTKSCLTDRLVRLGQRLVLAGLLGPTVAAAQGTGTVTTPSPLVDTPGSSPRVIEGMAPAMAPMPRAIEPPTFPTVIPIENPAVRRGTPAIGAGGARGRVIQLAPDTHPPVQLVPDLTGLVPDVPPGPIAPRPFDQVSKQVGDLIEVIQDPEAEIERCGRAHQADRDPQTAHADRHRQPGAWPTWSCSPTSRTRGCSNLTGSRSAPPT